VGISGRAIGGAVTRAPGGGGIGGKARLGGGGGGPVRTAAGALFVGGRTGGLMRAFSRASGAPAGFRGGNVMRTVSFFGSFSSLMRGLGGRKPAGTAENCHSFTCAARSFCASEPATRYATRS
jgi:hypothetical protein